MNVNRDNVLFRLPASREMQFAAMPIIQSFIAQYDDKMQTNHLLPGAGKFELHYHLDIPDKDWIFWQAVELELKQQPEEIGRLDMEIDMREDAAMAFYAFDRHLTQIYGSMCGIAANPVPKVRMVRSALDRNVLEIDCDEDRAQQHLMYAVDDEISCVVGRRSWLTYWATAMNLPVIEIITSRDHRNWLSKWCSPIYRIIETDHMDLLDRALDDLHEVVALIREHEETKARTKPDGDLLSV
jgi:hypothetical protein